MILKNSFMGAKLTRSPRFTAYVSDDTLTLILDRNESAWPLLRVGGAELVPGIVWAELTIQTLDGERHRLDGIDKTEGGRWLSAFEALQHKVVATAGKQALELYGKWASKVSSQLPNRWHPTWMGEHLAKANPPEDLPCGLSVDAVATHPAIKAASEAYPNILPSPPPRPAAGLALALSRLNEALFEEQKGLALFDTLESTPLTLEQRLAVVCFDSKLLLVAAAGSGKTATMVAKAAYAIATGLVRPDEILMLAFNADAAKELEERLEKRLKAFAGAEQIACRTFHSFGLSVIGEATGAKPRPAAWLEGDQDLAKVEQIMNELCQSDPAFNANLMLVRRVFAQPIGSGSGASSPNADEELITCRGETVKSRQEQVIADWLFFHGVDYQYEPAYAYDTSDAQHSQYHPDFYYPEINLYHEHFALDANGNPPREFKGYAEGVEWKRALHQQHGTELFETTSHTLVAGTGLPALQEALESRGLTLKPDFRKEPPGRPPLEFEALARILRNIMQHAKGNQLSPAELSTRAGQVDPVRGPLIISLYAKVLERWQAELSATGTVDFDDMINLAIEHAESGRYRSPYKLVIADEYQDASAARARLLRAITARPDTFLTAVGDDAQSINRFAGADMSVMRNFQQFYGSGTVLKLTQTFRCPEEICRVSSNFVMQNPIQIPKEVRTASKVSGRVIRCYAAKHPNELASLVAGTVTRITAKLTEVWDQPRKATIMLLGRYRSDRPDNMAELAKICGNGIEISFNTVHSSKGTEADYVLLLNVIRGRKGFPSEIADDPVLQCAMPLPEKFPFAEERRLFYVALTRARRGVFIFTVQNKQSAFLIELAQRNELQIVGRDGEPLRTEPCPACKDGLRKLIPGRYGDFFGCTNYPRCSWKEKARPTRRRP